MIINTHSYRVGIRTISDYSPFGVLLENRSVQSGTYRYGFQGQESDDEVSGVGNSYSAEYWQYDSRLGRRWNLDPIIKEHESPFACFANNPVFYLDPNGADTANIVNGLKDSGFNAAMPDVNKSPTFLNFLQSFITGENSDIKLEYIALPVVYDYKTKADVLAGQALLFYDGVHVADMTTMPKVIDISKFTIQIQLNSEIKQEDGTSYQIEELTAIKGITLTHEMLVHAISNVSLIHRLINNDISGDEFLSIYKSDIDHEDLYAGKCLLYIQASNEIVERIREIPTPYKLLIGTREDKVKKQKRLGPIVTGIYQNNSFIGNLNRKQLWRILFDNNMTRQITKKP